MRASRESGGGERRERRRRVFRETPSRRRRARETRGSAAEEETPKSGREAPTTQGNFGGPIAKVASRFWDNAIDLESEAPKFTLGWFPSEQERTEEFKHFGNESSRERRCK